MFQWKKDLRLNNNRNDGWGSVRCIFLSLHACQVMVLVLQSGGVALSLWTDVQVVVVVVAAVVVVVQWAELQSYGWPARCCLLYRPSAEGSPPEPDWARLMYRFNNLSCGRTGREENMSTPREREWARIIFKCVCCDVTIYYCKSIWIKVSAKCLKCKCKKCSGLAFKLWILARFIRTNTRMLVCGWLTFPKTHAYKVRLSQGKKGV